MRKVIAAINVTLDGFCDHTAMKVDEQVHQYYTDLLTSASVVLYGRKSYQLMESFWPNIAKNPTGNKAVDDYACTLDQVPKIVFSHTLDSLHWGTAQLAIQTPAEEVLALKQQQGSTIVVGPSPSLIMGLLQEGLLDELQLIVYPVLVGKGLTFFQNLADRIDLQLVKTKTFDCGAINLYYCPNNN